MKTLTLQNITAQFKVQYTRLQVNQNTDPIGSSLQCLTQIPSVAWFSHNQAWYLFNMWSSGVTFKTTRKC